MYPQTVVPSGDGLHTILTNGMDVAGSGVIATGDYYTANVNGSAWSSSNQEENPVYEHDNKRYVRVTPFAWSTDVEYTYNNKEPIEQIMTGDTSYRWFKVEPIKWIILNFNQLIVENDDIDITTDLPRLNTNVPLELYAADVLMSGIRFGASGKTLWKDSDINSYLNTKFHDEAFSPDEANLIQDSTIFNNNSDGTEFDKAAYGLNSNHLTDGSGMNPTNQKIYMLSYYELFNGNSPYINALNNPIFTSDANRSTKGTDYARAHNLWVTSVNTCYFSRTASSTTLLYRVFYEGEFHTIAASSVGPGTRPAFPMVYLLPLYHQMISSSSIKQKAQLPFSNQTSCYTLSN